jgi:hypothetical protein
MFSLKYIPTAAMSNKDIVQELRHLPKVLKEFVDDSTNLVDSLRKFGTDICTLVEEATQKIDYLKHAEINCDARATFGESLPNIYRRAMMCISSTGKVLHDVVMDNIMEKPQMTAMLPQLLVFTDVQLQCSSYVSITTYHI